MESFIGKIKFMSKIPTEKIYLWAHHHNGQFLLKDNLLSVVSCEFNTYYNVSEIFKFIEYNETDSSGVGHEEDNNN